MSTRHPTIAHHASCGTTLRTALLSAVALLGTSLPTIAQQHDPSMHEQHMRQSSVGHAHSGASSPYVELTERVVKALSEDEIRGLRSGEGMGFALAAELNGYPGPKHVLELADALELSADQRTATERVFEQMAETARRLGDALVEAEARLDRSFAEGSIDSEQLDRLTAAAARTRGELRAAHLRAHLSMMDVLTGDQVRRYAELRGY